MVLTILSMSNLSQNFLSCNWRFFWCVFFITTYVIERSVWNIVLASNSKDTASRLRHVWNWRKYEWVSVSGARSISLDIWSLTSWLIVKGLSSDSVLIIKEGRCLHDSTNHILISWTLEQIEECIVHFLSHSLVVSVHFVWSCEVWRCE